MMLSQAPGRREQRAGPLWLGTAALAFVAFVALTTYVVVSPEPGPLDLVTYQRVVAIRTPMVTSALQVVTALGSVPVVVAVALAAAGGMWLRNGRRLWYPTVLLAAVGATAGCVFLLKIVVGRARPPVGSLIGTPSLDFSFPSGHTTDGTVVWVLTAVVFATVILRRIVRVVAVMLAMLLALVIGFSRVYLGYHWATDVIGGWLLACSLVTGAIVIGCAWRPDPSKALGAAPEITSRAAAP